MLTPHRVHWRHVVAGLVLALAGTGSAAATPGHQGHPGKLSEKARAEAKAKGAGKVDVLVRFRHTPGSSERTLVRAFGGEVRRQHRSRWMALRVPARLLETLADNAAVEFIAIDAAMGSSAMEVGRQVADQPGPDRPESALNGAGVTIAMLDSGVAAHPEIQTLVAAVDLVGTYDPTFAPQSSIDPDGHGTHVAGIMVSNGSHSSEGRFAGIAPQASLVSVRVLDESGRGTTSTALAGLEWVLDHKDQYGIRVLNLSLGHPVYEPIALDPLVQAVDRLWDAGVAVVCAAGNAGKAGHGTIGSPCNSRKAITVGSLNDRGTPDTIDDIVGRYSSRGPTRVDLVAKPDILAPGNKIVSALAPGSYIELMAPLLRVEGDPVSRPGALEHLRLTGTSMAAPLVAGTAALMLQQDPSLNPGTIKARLMLSARKVGVGDPFATGAGILDILAALQTTGSVADAPSPLVFTDTSIGQLSVENTAVLWSNPAFSLQALWSNAVIWSDGTQWDQAVVSSSAILWPSTTADALLWPDASLWPEATLWPESTLWAESILWDDQILALNLDVDSLSIFIEDP